MSPDTVRVAFDTLSQASILVLLVAGMAVIVGMMRILNMCQGELVLLGAIVAYGSYSWFGSVLLGILLAPLLVGACGVLLERGVVRRFYASPPGALLATFAVGVVIRAIVLAAMTSQAGVVPAPLDGTFALGGAQLSTWRLAILVVTVAVIAGGYLTLHRTSLGMRVRATLDNPELASATGISVHAMYAGTFAVGAAAAGFAGAMIVPLQTLYPNLGLDNLIPMFIAVLVGGLGTLHGPLLGAVVLGLAFGLLPQWMSPVFSQVVVILVAVVFMRFRPAGLVTSR